MIDDHVYRAYCPSTGFTSPVVSDLFEEAEADAEQWGTMEHPFIVQRAPVGEWEDVPLIRYPAERVDVSSKPPEHLADTLTYDQRKALRRLGRGQTMPRRFEEDPVMMNFFDGGGPSQRCHINEVGKKVLEALNRQEGSGD